MLGMLFFVSLLGWGLVVKTLVPRIGLGVSIFCALIGMLLFSYTSMIIFGVFASGAYLLMGGGIAAFVAVGICCIYRYRKEQAVLLNKNDLFIILVYVMCIIGFVMMLSDGALKVHDAYSFWARAARELYLFDKGYFNADTSIAHWDYNPIFATLQYAITKAFGWSTQYLFFVIIGCFVTSMCAIMDFIEAGYKAKIIFLVLTVLFYPSIAVTYSTTFLGADGSMALLFVTGVLCWNCRKKSDWAAALPTVLAAVVLPAVKLYSGLMLAAVLVIMVLVTFRKRGNRAAMIVFVAMIAGVLYMQFSWSAYYNYNVDKAAYERRVKNYEYQGIDNDITAEEPKFKISYLFKGNPRTTQLSTGVDDGSISEMVALSKSSIKTFLVGGVYNSPMSIATMVLLVMTAYAFLAWEERKTGRKEMENTAVWICVAAAVYVAGMFGTYLVQPGTANEPTRYIGVVVIPMVIVLLYYACKYWEEQDGKLSAISKNILLSVLLILIIGSNSLRIWNAYSADQSLEYRPATYAREILENELGIIEEFVSADERVLIIDNNRENEGLGESGIIHAYQYYLLPRRGKMIYFDFGNQAAVETMTDEYLKTMVVQYRIDVMAIIADGEEMQNRMSDILGIPIEAERVYLVDTEFYDGEINYMLRNN